MSQPLSGFYLCAGWVLGEFEIYQGWATAPFSRGLGERCVWGVLVLVWLSDWPQPHARHVFQAELGLASSGSPHFALRVVETRPLFLP